MEFMQIPEGEVVRSASDLFQFDENDAYNFRELYVKYKNKLPMLICIQGGNYGTTRYDCYDNFQVIRLHCISLQPRAAAEDTRRVKMYKDAVLTIPEKSLAKFQQVIGHDKYGSRKRLGEILADTETFPVHIAMANDPGYAIRVGTSRQISKDFEHLLIKIRYKEPFFMMNCIDMSATGGIFIREATPSLTIDLKMNSVHCMACLCEDLVASPITGFKYKSKISFEKYCNQLTHQAATSGEVYDITDGNPDFCEYPLNDFLNLLDVCEHKEGIIERVIEEEPELSEDDEYEEIPPMLPSRKPVTNKQEEKKKANVTTEVGKTIAKKTSTEDNSKPEHEPPKAKHGGLISKLIHHGNKAVKRADADDTSNKAYKLSKPRTSESDDGVEMEKVPDRPPKPAVDKVGKPPAREKVTPDRQTNVQTDFKHREYQNTKVGRATVKPMQQVQTKTEHSVEQVKEEDEDNGIYCEAYEYEEACNITETEESKKLQHKPSEYVSGRPIEAVEADEGDVYEVLKEYAEVKDEAETVKTDVTEVTTLDKKEQFSTEVLKLSIDDICESLKALRLKKYVPIFRENLIDGSVLCELEVADMMETLEMGKLEAIRLHAYSKTGRIPK